MAKTMLNEVTFYDNEAAMEPLMPTDLTGQLKELAARLHGASAKLAGSLHPVTRSHVAELVRHMNSYYSNLIEGHHTHPIDIERALNKDYSKDPAKRALQLESAAHIEVEAIMMERLPGIESVNSDAFIQMLHREFYQRMPEEFRIIKSGALIVPGEYRKGQVTVGAHFAPDAAALPRFMGRFAAAYDLNKLDPLDRIIAAAAAHHRFAWIHPFQDGNGRVVRLFSHAYLAKAKIETGGLWTMSRGLARNVEEYREMLARADYSRQGAMDGRGNLSNRELVGFCDFFLSTALDQVEYMASLLQLDAMQDRIMRYSQYLRTMKDAPEELGVLMREIFLRGSVPRGEAPRLLQMPARTARRRVAEFIAQGWICSESSLSPLTLKYSSGSVGYLFPKLYPESVELSPP